MSPSALTQPISTSMCRANWPPPTDWPCFADAIAPVCALRRISRIAVGGTTKPQAVARYDCPCSISPIIRTRRSADCSCQWSKFHMRAAVRRAIQNNGQESLRVLAERHWINPRTVAKWRSRSSTADVRPGPKDAHSTVLSIEEEAIIVAFRKHTLLPLDDCLYALQATIPHLTRSSLYRCLQRRDISRLPEVEGDKPQAKQVPFIPDRPLPHRSRRGAPKHPWTNGQVEWMNRTIKETIEPPRDCRRP
jgi:hypothetical protein